MMRALTVNRSSKVVGREHKRMNYIELSGTAELLIIPCVCHHSISSFYRDISRCFVFVFVSLWLRNNEPEATKKHTASLPRREELIRLKKELCHKFDLADIRYIQLYCSPHRELVLTTL